MPLRTEAGRIEDYFLRWCKQQGLTSKQYIDDQRAAFFAGYNCKKGRDNRSEVDDAASPNGSHP